MSYFDIVVISCFVDLFESLTTVLYIDVLVYVYDCVEEGCRSK